MQHARSWKSVTFAGILSLAGLTALVGLAGLAGTGCASETVEEDGAAIDESDEALSLRPVEELKKQLKELLGSISAAQEDEYIKQKDARTYLRQQIEKAGFSPEKTTFVLRPKKFALSRGVPFDHSEIDVTEARQGTLSMPMEGRLLGDIWGAGVFEGTVPGNNLGPPLCVNWDELQDAVDATYVRGAYLITFVCHNITFRALDELDISVRDYSSNVRGWKLASYAFGPIFADTASASATSSAAAKKCVAMGIK